MLHLSTLCKSRNIKTLERIILLLIGVVIRVSTYLGDNLGVRGDLVSRLDSLLHQAGGGEDAGHEAPLRGLLGGDGHPGQVHLHRPGHHKQR